MTFKTLLGRIFAGHLILSAILALLTVPTGLAFATATPNADVPGDIKMFIIMENILRAPVITILTNVMSMPLDAGKLLILTPINSLVAALILAALAAMFKNKRIETDRSA